MSESQVEATRCARCQAPAAEGAAFCVEGGARVERACPSCRTTDGVSARFCLAFGAPLQAALTSFPFGAMLAAR